MVPRLFEAVLVLMASEGTDCRLQPSRDSLAKSADI